MDAESMLLLAKAICIISIMSVSPAQAYLAARALDAIGRNPKLENSLFGKVIVLIALLESSAIYALVAFFTI